MEWIVSFFASTQWWIYLVIFILKVIEIAIGTVRTILVNKGYSIFASLISIIEILLWVFVASSVLVGLTEAPLKGVIYAAGFAVGVYVGSILERWLAFGKVMIQVITSQENSLEIASFIREHQIGITEIDAHGYQGDNRVLLIFVNRKGSNKVIQDIKVIDEKAMIVSNDVSTIKGGTVPKRGISLLK